MLLSAPVEKWEIEPYQVSSVVDRKFETFLHRKPHRFIVVTDNKLKEKAFEDLA